ncbi:MAG: segregation/condensation protein A [Methylotetracoccus sp.]|nr:segregation/condensation protein A [Methylotetracoccus sp.]
MTQPPAAEATPTPVAVVNGNPLVKLPEDLYIPPEALEVFLETFEGPLDLLLYLIRRQNLDILDVPIAEVTRQYIAYIDMMQEMKMELAAEYLLMAAILAEIKSRMLLPKPEITVDQEDDPRAELVRRLQEYERFKNAAQCIDQLPRWERDVFGVTVDVSRIEIPRILPTVDLKDVLSAFQDVLKRAEQVTHHQIQREQLSVRERMSAVLSRLMHAASVEFRQLLDGREGRQGVIVSFLAILELARENLVEIVQEEPLAELLVRRRGEGGVQFP